MIFLKDSKSKENILFRLRFMTLEKVLYDRFEIKFKMINVIMFLVLSFDSCCVVGQESQELGSSGKMCDVSFSPLGYVNMKNILLNFE